MKEGCHTCTKMQNLNAKHQQSKFMQPHQKQLMEENINM